MAREELFSQRDKPFSACISGDPTLKYKCDSTSTRNAFRKRLISTFAKHTNRNDKRDLFVDRAEKLNYEDLDRTGRDNRCSKMIITQKW